jgi:Tat protein secretion system quality control protein TatD with DNase activity
MAPAHLFVCQSFKADCSLTDVLTLPVRASVRQQGSPWRVIAEADKREASVLAVTTTPKAFLGNVRLTKGRKRIQVAVGLHPELVATRYKEVDDVRKLIAQTKYVGEIGIDGSPDHTPGLDLQTEVLSTILTQAEAQGGKILTVHFRGSASVRRCCGVGKAENCLPQCPKPPLYRD